jgi:ABC-type molybdate transport system substrate-binding protein
VAASKAAAGRYLAFLRTQGAKAIFEKYGFSVLIRPVS